MKAVPIAMLGLLATVGAATGNGTPHAKRHPAVWHEATTHPKVDTVESVARHGNTSVVVLQDAKGGLFNVKVAAGATIGTETTARIMASDLRSGDRLVLQPGGRLQDVSQRTATLAGVVTYAPVSNSDVMMVQISPARTVLVDVDARTQYTDKFANGKTSITDIVDSDTVAINGVLDSTMDEVVVVSGIERLGPKLTRKYSSG